MKKFICLLIVMFALLFGLSACGGTMSFESEEAMMQYLSGMWVVETLQNDKDYYIFQDGKMHHTNDATFAYEVDTLMDATLADKGLEPLVNLDFHTAVKAITAGDLLRDPVQIESINPKKGTIEFEPFTENNTSKKIVVKENSVVFIDHDKDEYPLVKLADSADFTGEHFKELFTKTRNEYSQSCDELLPSTMEYAKKIEENHPDIGRWILVAKNDSEASYSSDGTVSGKDGVFYISSDFLSISIGQKDYNNQRPFTLLFNSEGDSPELWIFDRKNTSLSTLLADAAPLLESFPGALSATELSNLFWKNSGSGLLPIQMEETVDGVKYKIDMLENTTIVSIVFPAKFTLSTYPLNENPTKKLYDVLDYATVWRTTYEPYEGATGWPLYFGFEENGTCYYAMYSYNELYAAGKGNYEVYDNGTLLMDFTEGRTNRNTYSFDVKTKTLLPINDRSFGKNKLPLTKTESDFDEFKNLVENHINPNASTEEEETAQELDPNKLLGVLDYDTAWQADYTYSSEDYYVWFGFDQDGKCYYILGDMEIYGGGKGTYTVKDDNTIVMKMKSSGKTYTDTYSFDAATKTLTLQEKGMLGKAGTKFVLGPSDELDFEKLKEWGGKLAS